MQKKRKKFDRIQMNNKPVPWCTLLSH